MTEITISVARSLDDLIQVSALRAIAYMAEQHCPFVEEFDGNDFSGATHLLARIGIEPVAAMRIRWFSGFAKFERICVLRSHRGSDVSRLVVERGFELAARKGYRKALAHIQQHLLPHWERVADFRARPHRPRFRFSDLEYIEVERDLDPPANALSIDTPALQILRPEGDWDRPGVLDRSAERHAQAMNT